MPASVTHEARKHSRPVGRITAKESPRKRRGERGQRRPTPPLHFFAGGRELLAQIVPASTPRETNTLCEPARGAAAESVPGMSRKGAQRSRRAWDLFLPALLPVQYRGAAVHAPGQDVPSRWKLTCNCDAIGASAPYVLAVRQREVSLAPGESNGIELHVNAPACGHEYKSEN
jgi:hypothetical protein